MKRWKRLFYYLIINVIVSASTVLVVISLWGWTHPPKPCSISPDALKFPGTATPTGVQAATSVSLFIPPTAALPPTATPTLLPPSPVPLSGVITYTVKTGDTLGAIAGMYGLTVEEVMNYNHLDDPNRVNVGQKLRIPIPPTLTPTATLTPTITPTPTPVTPTASPTPVTPTQAPQVVIEGVIGAGELATEQVNFMLTGGGELSLLGWQLKDEHGHVFTFPQYTLHPGGQISLFTGAGSPSVNALYWSLTESIWKSGETVTLTNSEGNVMAVYKIP